MFGRSLHRDNRSDKELLDEALAVAAKSDVIVAALCLLYTSWDVFRTALLPCSIRLPDVKCVMAEA